MSSSPLLAVTLGDPRGVGPEVAVAAAKSFTVDDHVRLVLVGPEGTAADQLSGVDRLPIGRWTGSGEEEAGRLAGIAIERAARLALAGDVAGIVTAPIDKHALHVAGYAYPGHTEMLAALTDAKRVGMLMAAERTSLSGPLRVLLATTHVPLRAVPDAVTRDLLVRQTRLLEEALRTGWDIERPGLALCALNPHASDRGLFGTEEEEVLEPAVRELRAAGTDITGPIPADTVFLRAARGEFDAVVAPYHDVGMAAFKTAAFGHGVNVTLGLPFIRTSPDHGTALDIAGRGTADATSMIEAVRLAARLVAARARGGGARVTAR